MLLVDSLSKSNVFEINQTPNTSDDEPSQLHSSESMIDTTMDSISAITIPLISSQPILAVSPNYIFVNEYTKKKNRLVFIDDNLNRFFIRSPIQDTIIDALWHNIEQKFFLLTPRKIFSYDPNEKILESISDIKSDEKKPFKSFTIDYNPSSLLIAYDEWEAKFIDRWKQDDVNGLWKLIERLPINLTSDEFIGMILATNEDGCLKVGMTIYNNLTEQWRMELRNTEMLICLKKIFLPGSDPMYDYRIMAMTNLASDIQWLIYSQATNEIIAMDSEWKKIHWNYKFPVYRMAQFRENNLIIRTKK